MNAHSRSDLNQSFVQSRDELQRSFERPHGQTNMASGVSSAGPTNLPLHDARALTDGGVQAMIDLDGQSYFLRITRAGKLILTK